MFALIPAAGYSRRMGRPKLSLPLGHRTVLERTIDALRGAGCDVLVILAPHTAELAPAADHAGARVLQLADATAHMRETIERGFDYLNRLGERDPQEPWLLVPADHPTLDSELVRHLVAEFERQPRCAIAVPTFAGQRGHPALARWHLVAGLRAFDPTRGLNAYFRQFTSATLEVPVPRDDVLWDLDTPADYSRLCERFEKNSPVTD